MHLVSWCFLKWSEKASVTTGGLTGGGAAEVQGHAASGNALRQRQALYTSELDGTENCALWAALTPEDVEEPLPLSICERGSPLGWIIQQRQRRPSTPRRGRDIQKIEL